jgi:hypothetical protein
MAPRRNLKPLTSIPHSGRDELEQLLKKLNDSWAFNSCAGALKIFRFFFFPPISGSSAGPHGFLMRLAALKTG